MKNSYKRKIILDTNFLVAPFQLSIDIFDELEEMHPESKVYTIEDVVHEAKSIEEGKYKKLVEKLLETQDIEVLETTGEGTVDDLLVELPNDFTIATNDKELKNRLLDKGKEVIIIRSKNHLKTLNSQTGTTF